MFARLGHLVVTRARLVLALAAVVLLLSAVSGVGVFSRLLSGGFDDPSSASSQAKVLLDQHFGGEPDLIFLVHARSGDVDSVAKDGQALTARLAADHRLTGVTSYWTTHNAGLRSKDGSDALILSQVVGDDEQATKTATTLLSDYAHLDDSTVTVTIGGQLGTDIGGQVGKDLALAESIAVPLTLVLLILAFGSLVSALLPLSVGVIAIFATFAELNLLTHVTSVSIFALNLTTALGLGLGIDYALLMVSRFREELLGGAEVAEAVARTVATAGRTIAFSALTVAAALSAMLVFPVYFLRSFAYAGVGGHGVCGAERPAGAAGAADGARPPGQRRPGARDHRGTQPGGTVLGSARDRRDAPPAAGCHPGHRRAALPGGAAAARQLRQPRRPGTAQELGQPSGRRRPARRLRHPAQHDRPRDPAGAVHSGTGLVRPRAKHPAGGCSAPTARRAASRPARRRRPTSTRRRSLQPVSSGSPWRRASTRRRGLRSSSSTRSARPG